MNTPSNRENDGALKSTILSHLQHHRFDQEMTRII